MSNDESQLGLEDAESLRALERFVVENDDLLVIESAINRFNVFEALGITHAEIRHSNFLAFLLDPEETHGLGQLVLKAFLMDILKNAPPSSRPLSPIDLDGVDLRGVEVRREWKNIDLLILCKEPQFAVVIENKIGSTEHSGQLCRYRGSMAEHFPDLRVLCVFLSVEGDEPSDETWLTYTYDNLHEVLRRVRDSHRNSIGAEVLVFINHYLDLLETRFMTNKQLDDLCQRVFKNHRRALELIWERVGGPEADRLDEVERLVESDPKWHLLYRSGKYFEFIPKSWTDWLLPLGTDDAYPFCVSLRSKECKFVYTLWIGPWKDPSRRSVVITQLREKVPEAGFSRTRASRLEGKWNRVSAAVTLMDWSEDDEPDADKIRASVTKKLDQLHTSLEKLAPTLKPA